VVVDDRDRFLTKERFPEAEGFISLSRPVDAAEKASPTADLCGGDEPQLPAGQGLHPLVPRHRRRLHRLARAAQAPRQHPHRLAKEGVEPSEETSRRSTPPPALDVGAEGPEEVAWAIMAEVLAVRAGHRAGFLRDRRVTSTPAPTSSPNQLRPATPRPLGPRWGLRDASVSSHNRRSRLYPGQTIQTLQRAWKRGASQSVVSATLRGRIAW